jgi:CheY-like chemotaxis protein
MPFQEPPLLLLNGDHSLQGLLQLVLERETARKVYAADESQTLLKLAESIVPALILMDWAGDEMSGEDVLSVLRSSPRTAGIPVVVLSGHNGAAALAGGAAAFHSKPVHLSELVATVLSLLGQRGLAVAETPPASFDRMALRRLREEVGVTRFVRLLGAFGEEIHRRADHVRWAMESGDGRLLEVQSHALSTSASTFGQPGLAQLARGVERECRANGGMAPSQSARQLLQAIASAEADLRRYLAPNN